MDILISIIISGMAVGYVTEILSTFANPRIIKLSLTLPLSYLACWLLGLLGPTLIVAGLAAAFFSLATLQLLNRPVNIQSVNRRR